ncbi:MAG TPA: hypothetical protein VFS40_10115 [Gemmatimonadales bacterium]|nr:hypothetical protein [Gemmatimonadales bacterium]
MSDQPRDWDKELAEIDRAMGRMPAPAPERAPGGSPPAPAVGRGPDAAAIPVGSSRVAAPGRPAATTGRHVAAAWLRVLLAVALGVALVFWPYPKSCGLQLTGYLVVAALTVLMALWAAFGTWRHRRGFGHVVALLALGWGAVALAMEVLPRIGYAREALTWRCVAPAPTTAPPAAAPANPVPANPVPANPAPANPAPTTSAPPSPAPAQ